MKKKNTPTNPNNPKASDELLAAVAGQSLRAVTGYAPWQPPFRYNMDGQWIEDSKGNRMLDMRGWGYMIGKGSEALGMDEDAAAKIQDAIGQRTAELLNADVKVHTDEKLSDSRPL